MKEDRRPLVLDWKEAFDAGAEACGGKGWNLARLNRYGFSVPGGGVLASRAYLEFVRYNGIEERLQECAREMDGLEPTGDRMIEVSNDIHSLILSGRMPPFLKEEIVRCLSKWELAERSLAVRSSAAGEDSPSASFAGIHRSTLNVRGGEGLLAAIKDCWSSLWSPRAAAYRRAMGLPGEPSPPGVVIMAMVDAVSSGVAFTCHPGSGREDQVFISANFGLGESVVGGVVDPDEYAVNVGFHAFRQSLAAARTGRKEKRSVPAPGGGTRLEDIPDDSARQVLSDELVLRLARLVRRVYCALGNEEQHQDVEWAFDGKELHLLQSRPATAVPRYTYPALKGQPTIWTNANFRDTIPMVIPPLSWSSMTDVLDTTLKAVMNAAGFPVLPGVSRKRLYCGRGYFNISVTQWENYDCFASQPEQISYLIGGHHPVIRLPQRESYARLPGRIRRNLAFIRNARRVGREVDAQFEKLSRKMSIAEERDLTTFGDEGLLNFWVDLEEAYRECPDTHFALVGSGVSFALMTLLLKRYFPGRSEALANALLAGGETTTSADHGYRLVDLGRIASSDPAARAFLADGDADPASWKEELPESSPFRNAFAAFLDDFGHRGVCEWDLRTPRWAEDQSWLLDVVRSSLDGMPPDGVENLRRRQEEVSDKARREVFERVPFYLRPFLRGLLSGASRETVQREMARSTVARVVGLGRVIALECGRRFVERGLLGTLDDVFFLYWGEVQAVLTGEDEGRGLSTLVADRRRRHEELEKLTPPDYLEEDTPHRAAPERAFDGDTLTGIGVSAGWAEGPARAIRTASEGRRLIEGDVLVAPATDPAWTPLFLRASALVMETGGIISHGAIVAREYGIPAVVNIPGALQVLTDGTDVIVNGDEGKVRLRHGNPAVPQPSSPER